MKSDAELFQIVFIEKTLVLTPFYFFSVFDNFFHVSTSFINDLRQQGAPGVGVVVMVVGWWRNPGQDYIVYIEVHGLDMFYRRMRGDMILMFKVMNGKGIKVKRYSNITPQNYQELIHFLKERQMIGMHCQDTSQKLPQSILLKRGWTNIGNTSSTPLSIRSQEV